MFSDGENDVVMTVLTTLEGVITGDWGKAICTLAIVGVGFGCFVLGTIPFARAIAVALGAVCVMAAPKLLSLITAGT